MSASTWQSPEWVKLRDGSACPMCADLHLEENPFSVKIAETSWSFIRLPRSQPVRGYVLVATRRHVCELDELTSDELAGFWSDVARVGGAIQRLCRPAKLNYLVMGNLCPHVHCHVLPRGFEDDSSVPPCGLLGDEVVLPDTEYAELLEELRRELAIA